MLRVQLTILVPKQDMDAVLIKTFFERFFSNTALIVVSVTVNFVVPAISCITKVEFATTTKLGVIFKIHELTE